MSLLDSLDDNSHRHAFAVSADLKHALRESIELIGNEVIRYLREVRKERVYRLDDKLAGQLGQEALRYMYRLLFLFYIEARPELGYAPVNSEAYRKGYSLEHLRDLELVRLTGSESLNGYHFLLPDPGMADYSNKAAIRYEVDNFARIKEWRKAFCQPFTAGEIAELEALSARVDELWALHTEQLARDRRETEDTLPVWEAEGSTRARRTSNDWKDHIRDQGVFSVGTRTVGPYRRLKLVMDYWCALWFWPISEAARLPTRDDFLNEVSLVLKGSVFHPGVGPNQSKDLFGEEYAEHAEELAKRITNEIGMLDLDRLFEQFPRLKFVDRMASCRHFHHWELVFADLFYGRQGDGRARGGGFDLVLGNPPWIKVTWTEGGVLGDFDPSLALRKHSAIELTRGRDEAFERYAGLREAWMTDAEDSEATQAFLNAAQNYPSLAKQQTNLFKCFLPQAWMIGSQCGLAGGLFQREIEYVAPFVRCYRERVYRVAWEAFDSRIAVM